MSLDTLQYFFQRIPRLDYVSPPICEMEFSSSAEPSIILNPHARRLGPTGLEVFTQDGRIFLRWNNYPGAICFSVYKAVDEEDPFGDFHLVAECVQEPVDITDFGPGTYRITAITADGETVVSDNVVVSGPGPDACIETPGPAAPLGLTPFEIDEEVDWGVHDIVTSGFYTDDGFPGGYAGFPGQFMFWDFPEDYPPGHYTIRYVLGFFDLGLDVMSCGASGHKYVNRPSGRLLVDDEWNGFVVGTSLADSFLWDSFQCGDPSFLGPVQVLMSADLDGLEAFIWNEHSNTGGTLRLVSGPSGVNPAPYPPPNGDIPDDFVPQFNLVQVDGLIQQPRGVRIANWATIQAGFSSDVFDNWNGEFPERTEYTQTNCLWTADPNGAFGGATVSYSQSVPASPTGTGWMVEIFVGASLVWRGFKKYDETGVGTYFRAADSPTLTPLCLAIEEI